jgi:hypothetical protein
MIKIEGTIDFVDNHYKLEMCAINKDGNKIGCASAITAKQTEENKASLEKLIPLNFQMMLEGILRHHKIPTFTWEGENYDSPKTYEPTWVQREDGVWEDANLKVKV